MVDTHSIHKMDVPEPRQFVQQARAMDGAGHSIGIDNDTNEVYTWGSNAHGQLCRPPPYRQPRPSLLPESSQVSRGFAGGTSDSGHTAVLRGKELYVCGCDRWQQLGLGSPAGGAGGYTWVGGKIRNDRWQKNAFVTDLLTTLDETATIRDVALGGDHTLVLSSNRRDVIAFGKAGESQLGLSQKAFLSAPAKSTVLSSSKAEIAAVCAVQHCSLTLNDQGRVLARTGKCRETSDFLKSLQACRDRAKEAGLLQDYQDQ